MNPLARWWHSLALAEERDPFTAATWEQAWKSLPLLAGLDASESARLRRLALGFLRQKTLEPAQGLALTDPIRLMIALQAGLPVLQLGLDWYGGWYSVIVYPDAFIPEHQVMGDDGVVWVDRTVKAGESWERGPIILSWADIHQDLELDGHNVIIHELAHKLDGRSGSTNGSPPLHRGMSGALWKRTFAQAYEDLCHRADAGEHTPIDPYATQSPAEFFAVVSEAFFEVPSLLIGEYPDVYGQLKAFYRQDPLRRLAGCVEGVNRSRR
ncbi:zinc-dependent peptidase [Thiorhodococcus mannitoliphagus]|uniref:Zinc-dependent peptidase n=1 Tax=Thiorhodococcus mannitoliphagus TaxID=329406 RepID=A0A6P1DY91_9GAMM|nr:M90 family metallopeptidase [Thiorhodococcus mannitoliphagus]NEX21112.1 zinc-dependent peptidase [Thiorhodococcus mannitoliphagus]